MQPQRSGDRLVRAWARSAVLTVPGAVAALGTAAVLHGVQGGPSFDGAQVVVPEGRGTRARDHLEPHQRVLGADDVVDVRGIRTTSAVRTLADLVPRLGRREALAVLDSALAVRAVDAGGLLRARDLAAGRRNSLAVADLWTLADGRAESPLESRTRLCCTDGGVPPDDLQVVVRDEHGHVVGRGDLCFRRRSRAGRGWLLLEADGAAVHSDPDALYRDRWRANAMVALGHDLIRCTWRDTCVPHRVPAMVRAAL